MAETCQVECVSLIVVPDSGEEGLGCADHLQLGCVPAACGELLYGAHGLCDVDKPNGAEHVLDRTVEFVHARGVVGLLSESVIFNDHQPNLIEIATAKPLDATGDPSDALLIVPPELSAWKELGRQRQPSVKVGWIGRQPSMCSNSMIGLLPQHDPCSGQRQIQTER